MLTSLNANNDLIRKLEESIMAVEEKFAERNVALLDDIKALHVEVHNKEKDRLKMHISQLQSSVNQKSSEINLLKQETNSGHCSKCISASDLVTKLQKEVDDLKSLLRCKEDCIDKLTAEAEILTRKNNDLMDTHGILLPQLEKGSALIHEKDLLIDKQQTVIVALQAEVKDLSNQVNEAMINFCSPSNGDFHVVERRNKHSGAARPGGSRYSLLADLNETTTNCTPLKPQTPKKYSSRTETNSTTQSTHGNKPEAESFVVSINTPARPEPYSPVRRKEVDLLIIGTSNVRPIDAKRIYPSLCCQVETLANKTILGAIKYVDECRLHPKVVVLHVAGNSLVHHEVERCIKQMDELITLCGKKFSGAKIIVSGSFPRALDSRAQSDAYRHKMSIFNDTVKGIVGDDSFISHPQLHDLEHPTAWRDNIHLSTVGIKIFVANLKRHINPLLGLGVYQPRARRFSTQNQQKPSYRNNSWHTSRGTFPHPRTPARYEPRIWKDIHSTHSRPSHQTQNSYWTPRSYSSPPKPARYDPDFAGWLDVVRSRTN